MRNKNNKIKGFAYYRRRKIKRNRRKQKVYSDNIGTILFYIFLLPFIGIYYLVVDSSKSSKAQQKSKIIKPATDLYEVNEAENTILTSTSTVSSITLQ